MEGGGRGGAGPLQEVGGEDEWGGREKLGTGPFCDLVGRVGGLGKGGLRWRRAVGGGCRKRRSWG